MCKVCHTIVNHYFNINSGKFMSGSAGFRIFAACFRIYSVAGRSRMESVLIITTFALGGSLCGYLGRKLLLFSGLEKGVLWLLIYIILITLLWPFCVLLVSIPLGQFSFSSAITSVRFWGNSGGKQRVQNHPDGHFCQRCRFKCP